VEIYGRDRCSGIMKRAQQTGDRHFFGGGSGTAVDSAPRAAAPENLSRSVNRRVHTHSEASRVLSVVRRRDGEAPGAGGQVRSLSGRWTPRCWASLTGEKGRSSLLESLYIPTILNFGDHLFCAKPIITSATASLGDLVEVSIQRPFLWPV